MKLTKESLLEFLSSRMLDIEESDMSREDILTVQIELLKIKQYILRMYSDDDDPSNRIVYSYNPPKET